MSDGNLVDMPHSTDCLVEDCSNSSANALELLGLRISLTATVSSHLSDIVHM